MEPRRDYAFWEGTPYYGDLNNTAEEVFDAINNGCCIEVLSNGQIKLKYKSGLMGTREYGRSYNFN